MLCKRAMRHLKSSLNARRKCASLKWKISGFFAGFKQTNSRKSLPQAILFFINRNVCDQAIKEFKTADQLCCDCRSFSLSGRLDSEPLTVKLAVQAVRFCILQSYCVYKRNVNYDQCYKSYSHFDHAMTRSCSSP